MTSHRRIEGRLVVATHNPGKLREMRDLLAPYGIDAVSAGELGLPRAGGDRHDLSGQRAASRREAAAQATASRPSPTIPASPSMRWAASPASTRRAGRARPRISTARCAGSSGSLQERGATSRHNAARTSCRRSASPGRTDSEEVEAGSTARWSGRRAALRVSATTRCSCPTGTTRTFGEMPAEEKHGLPPHGQTGLSHRARAFVKLAERCLVRN